MKKKIVGLSLAFAFAAGVVAVGASSFNYTESVDAAGENKTIYCKMDKSWWTIDGAAVGIHYWGGEGVEGTSWPGKRMTLVEGETTVWSYDVPANAANCIFTRVNSSGSIADWGAKTKDLTIPTDGKNLFTISTASEAWGDPGCDGEWSTYTPVTPSKYYISVGSKEKQELTKNPDNPNEYYLSGLTVSSDGRLYFYKDDELINPTIKPNTGLNCNNLELNDEDTLQLMEWPRDNGSFSVYLNVTENNLWVTGRTMPIVGYFGVANWENVYAYTYGGYAAGSEEYALGAWDDKERKTLVPLQGICIETHNGNKYGLYQFTIPVNSVGKNNNQIIFHNGLEGDGKAQTASLQIIDRAYYGAHYETTGDTRRFIGAQFVELIIDVLQSGEYKYGELLHSVCAISPEMAAEAVGMYESLDSDIKAFVDNATYWTYADKTSTEADKDFTFAEIFARLDAIAGGLGGSDANFYTTFNNDSTFISSIIAVSILALAGVAVLVIKRRKTIAE